MNRINGKGNEGEKRNERVKKKQVGEELEEKDNLTDSHLPNGHKQKKSLASQYPRFPCGHPP